MTTERQFIEVSGIQVKVMRKAIKNLHLGVYPPDGRVRIAAPLRLDDEAVRLAVAGYLGWIRRQQRQFREQARQSQREMVTGETHYVWGRKFRLEVVEQWGRQKVERTTGRRLRLIVNPGADRTRRERVLNEWYRAELKERSRADREMGAQAGRSGRLLGGVKRMRTRWGTCNPNARRLWLNLELAKKPPQCLKYIVVHEMVHLLERHHNDRFLKLMDRFMLQWRLSRDELNHAPLAHEEWSY